MRDELWLQVGLKIVAKMPTGLRSEVEKLQSSDFLARIEPGEPAFRFDTLAKVQRKPELQKSGAFDGRKRFETKPGLGYVADSPAVVAIDLNETQRLRC